MIKRWIIIKHYEFGQPEAHSWLYKTREEAERCSADWKNVTLEYVEVELLDTMQGTYYD